MILTLIGAILLIIFGATVALLGFKLFRLILPIVGLYIGLLVGYLGVEAIFGQTAFSFVVGVLIALFVGVIFAILSYLFYIIGVYLIFGSIGSSLAVMLGNALSLGDNGFILFLMSLSGFILGLALVDKFALDRQLIMGLTAVIGVKMVLLAILIIASDLTFEEIYSTGSNSYFREFMSEHFIWMMTWIGGSLVAYLIQNRTSTMMFLNDDYEFKS